MPLNDLLLNSNESITMIAPADFPCLSLDQEAQIILQDIFEDDPEKQQSILDSISQEYSLTDLNQIYEKVIELEDHLYSQHLPVMTE